MSSKFQSDGIVWYCDENLRIAIIKQDKMTTENFIIEEKHFLAFDKCNNSDLRDALEILENIAKTLFLNRGNFKIHVQTLSHNYIGVNIGEIEYTMDSNVHFSLGMYHNTLNFYVTAQMKPVVDNLIAIWKENKGNIEQLFIDQLLRLKSINDFCPYIELLQRWFSMRGDKLNRYFPDMQIPMLANDFIDKAIPELLNRLEELNNFQKPRQIVGGKYKSFNGVINISYIFPDRFVIDIKTGIVSLLKQAFINLLPLYILMKRFNIY